MDGGSPCQGRAASDHGRWCPRTDSRWVTGIPVEVRHALAGFGKDRRQSALICIELDQYPPIGTGGRPDSP